MTEPHEGMSPEDFRAWLDRMSLSQRGAAAALGISPTSVVTYKRDGAPLVVALACAALAAGLEPWPKEKRVEQFNVMLDLRGAEAAEEIQALDRYYGGHPTQAFLEGLVVHRVGSKFDDCDVSDALPQVGEGTVWTRAKVLGLNWRLGVNRAEPAFIFASEVEPFGA